VEYQTAALDLAARGVGDTVSPNSVLVNRGYGRRLAGVSFDPPLYETFAFITRRNAHLSPAVREFMAIAERRMRALEKKLASRE
jgi:DNA-binding transcriptional LysR family regulator